METPFDYLETTINGESLSSAYKIGFQAGQEDVKSGVVCADCIRHVLQDGRREVVKWAKQPCPHKLIRLNDDSLVPAEKAECDKCWQVQLKEWGIE